MYETKVSTQAPLHNLFEEGKKAECQPGKLGACPKRNQGFNKTPACFGAFQTSKNICTYYEAQKILKPCSESYGITLKPSSTKPCLSPSIHITEPQTNLSPYTKKYQTPNRRQQTKITSPQNSTMALDHTDEEFIKQFAALSSGQSSTQPLKLTHKEIENRNWNLTTMARVVSDRPTMDSNFASTMRRVWSVHPDTKITFLKKIVSLVQFVIKQDMEKVMQRGISTYRTEAVGLRRVSGPADLANQMVSQMEVWVQFHRISPATVSKEGLKQLSRKIGVPLSEVIEVPAGNNKFSKIKLPVNIDDKLLDTIEVEHPVMGVIKIYVSYERLNRICLFCAKVGHDHNSCPDKLRLERLRMDLRFQNRQNFDTLTKPKFGPWTKDPSLIPEPESTT